MHSLINREVNLVEEMLLVGVILVQGSYATFSVHILPLKAQEEGLEDHNLHVIKGLCMSFANRNCAHVETLLG